MPDNEQQLRRPYQQQFQVPGTDYAQMGMTACIAAVGASVIAGGIALARGKKPFHDKMVRFRMIVVVSATDLQLQQQLFVGRACAVFAAAAAVTCLHAPCQNSCRLHAMLWKALD